MSTLRTILFTLAAFCVVDGHLFVGQSLAWLTMIGDRAPQMGLQEAMADTFSGDSPCATCIAIQGERQEQREEAPIPDSRPDLKFAPVVFTTPAVLPAAPEATGPAAGHRHEHPASWTGKVPTPPPRLG